MTDASRIPSDRDLLVAARDGSTEAWSAFRSRHVAAVTAVADHTARAGITAATRTDEAFTALSDELLADRDPTDDGSVPAIRALRARAIAALTGGSYGPEVAASDQSSLPTEDVAREIPAVTMAFARLPELWQTVLWHRHVERSPASDVATLVGRSAAGVVALQQTAARGLFDAYCTVVCDGRPLPNASCRPAVTQLGGYSRGTLPAAQTRAVEVHVSGCVHCRRRLAVAEHLDDVLPAAIAPALTGLSVDGYRSAIGAVPVTGAALLAERRSRRRGITARVVAVAAVLVALLAAAFFIRSPFGDLQPQLADIVESAGSITGAGQPGSANDLDDPDDADADDAVDENGDLRLPSRIEFLFPGAPRGVVYVPGGRAVNLTTSVSTPGPVIAGATGTIDAGLTNNDVEPASVEFFVQVSRGVVFEAMPEGDGSCRAEGDGGATCSVDIAPGRTAWMSLRFAFDDDVPDRLVIAPGSSPSLEVPIEDVPDVIFGIVGRITSDAIGATFGPCVVGEGCPADDRDASSAQLDLTDGQQVESAVLVWEGDDQGGGWSNGVSVVGPGGDEALSVAATESGPASAPGRSPFRSVADVTDLVTSGGGGVYTVERPSGANGAGSWTLAVVLRETNVPRRLVIVTAPSSDAAADEAFTVEFPILGSVTFTADRLGALQLQGHTTADPASGTPLATLDGDAVGGDDPLRVDIADVEPGAVASYDLLIDANEEALTIVVSTPTGSARVAAVGLTLDIPS